MKTAEGKEQEGKNMIITKTQHNGILTIALDGRIFYIIDSRFHAMGNRFALVDVHRNDACCRHLHLHKKKGGDL